MSKEKRQAQENPEPIVTGLDSKEHWEDTFGDKNGEHEYMMNRIRKKIEQKRKARKSPGERKK